MADNFIKNTSVHISTRSFLNITFNIYQCGNCDLERGARMTAEEDDAFYMFYVNSGSGRLETGPYTGKVAAGYGFVVFPDVKYSLVAGEEQMNVTWVSFSGFRVDHYLGRASLWPTSPVFADGEGVAGEKLNRLYMASHRLPNRYCRMMSILYDIFSYLLDSRSPVGKMEIYQDTANYFTAYATQYIEQNYRSPITVEEIARVLGITRKHLCTVFNQVLQVTPKQFLIFYRMEKASKLLLGSNLSVQEVSEAVGYANPFYFSREFKRIVGKSPSDYRSGEENIEVFSYRFFLSTLMKQYKQSNVNLPGDWKIMITPPPGAEEERHETGK